MPNDITAVQQAQLAGDAATAGQQAVATEHFTRFKAACVAGDGYTARLEAMELARLALSVLPDVS